MDMLGGFNKASGASVKTLGALPDPFVRKLWLEQQGLGGWHRSGYNKPASKTVKYFTGHPGDHMFRASQPAPFKREDLTHQYQKDNDALYSDIQDMVGAAAHSNYQGVVLLARYTKCLNEELAKIKDGRHDSFIARETSVRCSSIAPNS